MVMTRSYRLVAYLPRPAHHRTGSGLLVQALLLGASEARALPHRAPNSTLLQDCDWPQKMFKIIFSCELSPIGRGERDAVFARPQEGHARENPESRGPSVQSERIF